MKEINQADKTEDTLKALRAKIDEYDEQIIKLIIRRLELVREIGEYKAVNGLPVVDEARERELLSARKRQAPPNLPVDEIFKPILEQSRQIQAEIKNKLSSTKEN